MTDDEARARLRYLQLKARAAESADEAPAPSPVQAIPQVGAGETFLNRAASKLPAGTQLVNTLTALGMKAFRPSAGARLTPQAAAELGTPQEAPAPSLADEYRQARQDFAQRTEAGANQNKAAALFGDLTGVGLSLAAPLPKVTVGSGAAGRVLSNALTAAGYGALNSAANSQGDLTKGEVGQVASDALGVEGLQRAREDWAAGDKGRALLDVMGAGAIGGGLTGGALSGAVEGVRASGGLQKASQAARGVAGKLGFKALGGMKPEVNQLGEDAARQIGLNALDEGVVTPLSSRKTQLERALAAKKAAGESLSGALGELDASASPAQRINPLAAAQRVDELARETAARPALRTTANKFANEAQAIRDASPLAPSGMSLQEFESEVARPYKQTTNWNTDLALPKETLKRLPRALESEVERAGQAIAQSSGNQAALDKYLSGKKDYGKFADIADIAEEGVKRDTAKKAVGLYDAMAALSGLSHSVAHGSPTGILGAAGGVLASKLASRFGNQVGATSANALARLLASAPGEAGQAGQNAAVLARLLGGSGVLRPALSAADAQQLQQYADALKETP